MIIAFRIHYLNGDVFTNLDGTWDDAPDNTISVIEVWDDVYTANGTPQRRLWHGSDDYTMNGHNKTLHGVARRTQVTQKHIDKYEAVREYDPIYPGSQLHTANKDGELDNHKPRGRMTGRIES